MKPIPLVLVGDQIGDRRLLIQSLVRHSRTSAGARRLLEAATDLVQLHFGQLNKQDRAWNHEVQTLLGLAEDNILDERPNGVIATALTCIGRLGELIVHAEQDPSILGAECEPVHVLAFCTGLLPAAALVAARSNHELVEIGIEMISITLRLSTAVQQRVFMIEDAKVEWSTTVMGITPEEVQPILDGFHKERRIPYPRRVAIGVVATGWLTLIGPPSSLRRLMSFSEELAKLPNIKVDTTAVGHSEYVPKYDLEAVIGESPLLDTPIISKARMLSPASCKPYLHTDLRSLLNELIPDITHRILRISDTVATCVSGLLEARPVSLTVAGPTAQLREVQRALKSKGREYHIARLPDLKQRTPSRGGSDLVAVVGMAARLPGSDTVDEFFENLLQGQIQIKKIPKSRFDLERYHDPSGERPRTTLTDQGAFLDHPGYFDNRLFNISPREALRMDPVHRLFMTVSYEALQSAGYSKDSTLSTQSNRISIFVGQGSTDWLEVLNNEEDIDMYDVTGLCRPFSSSRLAYYHKWGGATYAVDSGCSTSTTAIHLACKALNSRECDTALAGGGSICVSPTGFAGLGKAGMISNNGGCRTFHDDADGYARSEGVGVVVLKRLEDALAENDNILGVIRGHGRAYTSTSSSITHPSAISQARLFKEVLRKADVEPDEISYVEMHGTGTQYGDFEEMKAVTQVLGQTRSQDNILTIGGVKANMGHGEGVSGVTELIKVLMMLRDKKIPPQPGLPFKLNRNFPDLDSLHVQIAGMGNKDLTLRPSCASENQKIKCLISNFDATGGINALVVEEPPKCLKDTKHPLTSHVVTVSARTPKSLHENRKRLLEYLKKNPQTRLADLAYTTTARSMHEVLRVAYAGKSTIDIVSSLQKDVMEEASAGMKSKPPPSRIAFLFTGQGSQYAGMGRQLYRHSITFRELLQTYQQMAEHQGFPRFLHLIESEEASTATESPVAIQLAVVALEVATAQLLRTWGIEPDVVIGHSLGEYSALCVAGVLSGSDTLYLVGRRAQLMEQQLTAGEYTMLAVAKGVDDTRQLLDMESRSCPHTEIACINAPQVTVVSGPINEVNHLKARVEKDGSNAATLHTSHGFHSHQMDPILAEFEAVAKGVNYFTPKTPVVSTLLGRLVDIGEADVFTPSYLARQVRECVNFDGAVKASQAHHLHKTHTTWVEIGPDPVCIGLARRILQSNSHSFLPTMKAAEDNWTTLSATLASLYQTGVSINWAQYHKNFTSSLKFLQLPTYAFDEKDYWMPYIEQVDRPASKSCACGNAAMKGKTTPLSTFSTTSLHWIKEETMQNGSLSASFGSRLSGSQIYQAIEGLVLNGSPSVPLSLFTDMALSAAQYAYQKKNAGVRASYMSIHNAQIIRPLNAPIQVPEEIVETKVSLSEGDGAVAQVRFFSHNGLDSTRCGNMEVSFEENRTWFAQQAQTSFLINSRIEWLKEMSSAGKAHRLLKPLVYRLFNGAIAYGKNYRVMEEAWIDSHFRDAVGIIKLPNTRSTDKYERNPFLADGAIQLASLLVNDGLRCPEDIVCFVVGFEDWRMLDELRKDEVYTTYTAVQDTEMSSPISGAAYIFDSKQKLVQVITGIRFQKMKKMALSPPPPTGLGGLSNEINSSAKAFMMADIDPRTKSPSAGSLTPTSQISESSVSERDQQSDLTTPISALSTKANDDLVKTLLSIIISESGCSESQLEPNATFIDVGIDSLAGIAILSQFQRQTDIKLSPFFFLDHQTVAEAKQALSDGKFGRPSLAIYTDREGGLRAAGTLSVNT